MENTTIPNQILVNLPETQPVAQPQPTQPPPEPPMPPAPSRKSMVALFAFGIVLVILALILSYLGIRKNRVSQAQPSPTPATIPTQMSETPTEMVIMTLTPTVRPSVTGNTSPTVTITPSDKPQISSPVANAKVKSPLTVKGAAPANWFFEGTLVLQLLDDQRNVITQAPGSETTPGSWQGTDPVAFEGTLTFSTTAKSGYVIIQNDNPSGLTQNAKSYEIPVTF